MSSAPHASAYTTLGIVEDFFQEPLTEDLCRAVGDLPPDQAWELLERLSDACAHWFRRQRVARRCSDGVLPPFQPIFDSDGSTRSWQAVERWLKCGLLYYPGSIVVPDPIVGADDFEYFEIAASQGRPEWLVDRMQEGLARSLRAVVDLRPLLVSNVVTLMPFEGLRRQFDDATLYVAALKAHLAGSLSSWEIPEVDPEIKRQALFMNDLDCYAGESQAALDDDGPTPSSLRWLDDEMVEAPERLAREWLWAASQLGAAPVAATASVAATMDRAAMLLGPVARRDESAADLFRSFRVPGPDSCSLRDVVEMRQSESSFVTFRQCFEKIVNDVASADPTSPDQFTAEFKRALDREIEPLKKEILSQRRRKPSLEHALTSAFLFGAAAIETSITGAFPVGSSMAAGAATLGWAVPGVGKKRAQDKRERELRAMFTKLYEVS